MEMHTCERGHETQKWNDLVFFCVKCVDEEVDRVYGTEGK